MKNIKNIIFDLGAVLLNLDMSRTDMAFRILVGDKDEHQKINKKLQELSFFEKFETNEIEEKEFIETLRAHCPHPLADNQIRTAWSAMLLDFPKERIQLLEKLRKEGYRVFLLSNINSIHLNDVYQIIKEEHGNIDFDALFEKPYYSHLIGRRKPDSDTFSFVLEDSGILADETLFIDDNADNVKGAISVGIHSVHHKANSDINAFLAEYLNLPILKHQ